MKHNILNIVWKSIKILILKPYFLKNKKKKGNNIK